MTKKSALHRKVLTMAADDSGVAEAEISGYTVLLVRKTLSELVAAGELHIGKSVGRPRRFFTTKEKALAFEVRETSAVNRRDTSTRPQLGNGWAAGASAQETERTVYTRGPSPSERTFRSNTHAVSA